MQEVGRAIAWRYLRGVDTELVQSLLLKGSYVRDLRPCGEGIPCHIDGDGTEVLT